jgi:serine/threonine-protein kinase RIM15
MDISPDKGNRVETTTAFTAPSGALAPAARIDTHSHRPAPLSEPPSAPMDAGGASGAEPRRRYPHLSLRLDPRFGFPASQRVGERIAGQRHQQHASSSSTDSSFSSALFSSPQLPAGSTSVQTNPSARSTEGGSGMPSSWDNTPAPVPMTGSIGTSPTLLRAKLSRPSHGSVPPSFSMTSIRQHIRQRLTNAKESCDRELRKIIVAITAFVEHEMEKMRLQEEEEAALASRLGDPLADIAGVGDMDFGIDSDGAGNEAGDEADLETVSSSIFGRPLARTTSRASSNVPDVVVDSGAQSDSGLGASGSRARQITQSSSLSQSQPSTVHSSPSGTFSMLPPQRRASLAVARGRPRASEGSVASSRRTSVVGSGAMRYPSSVARSVDLGSSLSRAGTTSKSQSTSTSRSTSRSRSPLPGGHQDEGPESEKVSPFIATLQAIISIATEILDTPVATLISRPGSSVELIKRVQAIGKAWDDHPDWPCRGHYVQLLLAVAGLSRVVEWWEAEKGFWNFNDEDEADVEPLVFVSKRLGEPAADEETGRFSTHAARSRAQSIVSHPRQSLQSPGFPTPLGIDLGERFRPPSPSGADSSRHSSIPTGTQEDAPRLGAEELKQAVERVCKETLLMELQLDGQSFQHLTPVWKRFVG